MVQAGSIGRRAATLLAGPPSGGTVLACFDRVWNLMTHRGDVLALAWRGIPNGPFHILLDREPGPPLAVGTRFFISGSCLRFAGPASAIDLDGARCWDARPDWRALAANRQHIGMNLPTLAAVLAAGAPAGSLANLGRTRFDEAEFTAWANATGYAARARAAISSIQAATRAGDGAALHAAAARLCGLGPGLTPSGDDWLAGWLLALHLAGAAVAWAPGEFGPNPSRLALARAAVRAAMPSTTVLSRAFLACACDGEADEHWHRLLDALAYGAADGVTRAAHTILAHGATSGADMLTGFLAGLAPAPLNLVNDRVGTTIHNEEGYRYESH